MKKLVFVVWILSALSCSAGETYDGQGQKHALSTVVVAPIPSKLTFAGEEVPVQFPEVREALEREISVTMYMHSRTLLTLRATKRYLPYIESILKEYGVPGDFKYLCMAESNLNPNAISSAKAAGLWQFMVGTAKDHGIETGENVDLRYSIEESTVAAAKYLKAAYDRYGNWTMAAASYNLGMAGVSRRSDTQGVDNYYDLFLPEETMRYVYRILSMKMITENPAAYGFILKESDYQKPFKNYTTIKINDSQIDWSKLAEKYGTNYKILRILNPWIRSYKYENKSHKTYTVKIPNIDFRIKGY